MSTFVVNLTDYYPPARYDNVPWTQAQISYSPDNVQAYVVLATLALSPVDSNPAQPLTRNFTLSNVPTAAGWLQVVFLDAATDQAPTKPIQFPVQTGHGAASPTLQSALYGVRHRIRDGIGLLDANPIPFNMVRLEDLSDQIKATTTPTQTVFQCRYEDVPTQRYMNAQVVPGTLVAYLDGNWTAVYPTQDMDINGNFTLPTPPVQALLITYAWQYLSDGEILQFVDEARQWLREFSDVTAIPDGLVPALISFASYRALVALQSSAAKLTSVQGGDSNVDWSKLADAYAKDAATQNAAALKERELYYSQGPESLDPTAASVVAPFISPYTPQR